MGDLQATIEFLVELYKFYNVDLFIRGYYQFRFTFKPPKSSHAIQVEVCESQDGRGAFTLFPAFVTADGQTAVSRTFNIYYKDEEVLLKDVFLFRVNLLIDSTKAADCIEKTALEMNVDVHFTDQVVRDSNYQTLPLVTSRTLKFHLSCFNGLHHQVPLLFDYYYFSVLDLIIHANVVSLGLPNWSVLKQVKTGWFSKSAPRSASPLFFGSLFGNRYQLGSQFYSSDVALRYAISSSSITRENFERASAIHRNLCAILAMAHFQLLNYFEEMMQYLDEKQRIKLGDKLDPADLVEGLCKKLETLQSCEEVFDEICSDLSVLNNELALLWSQFQESFALNDNIRPLLREQHHHERMLHFSEAFFVHELPWKSLLNATDSSAQKHTSMGQCVKSSRYLSLIPPVTIECAEVDGDSSTTPIFFEDCYVGMTEACANQVTVNFPGGACMLEDEVLEHKPLSLGIFNEAFRDGSPTTDDSLPKMDDTCPNDDEEEIDVGEEAWVDINKEEIVYAAHVSSQENQEKGNGNKDERMVKLEEGSTVDDVSDSAVCLSEQKLEETIQNECQSSTTKEFTDETADNEMRTDRRVTLYDQAQQLLRDKCCDDQDKLSDLLARQQSESNLELREPLDTDDSGGMETDDIIVLGDGTGKSGIDSVSPADVQASFVEAVKSYVENMDNHSDGMVVLDLTKPTEYTQMTNDSFHSVIENHIGVEELRTVVTQEDVKEGDTTEHCMFSLVEDSESGNQDNKSNGSCEASKESDVMVQGFGDEADRGFISSEEIVIENVTGNGVDTCSTRSDIDTRGTGNGVDKCGTGSVVDKCGTGSDIDKCGTGNGVGKCSTGSDVDKCCTGNDVEKCCTANEMEVNKKEMIVDRTKGSHAVETRLDPFCLDDVKQSSGSEATTTVESKVPLNTNIGDSFHEDCQTRSVPHQTLERKVSNSVFYERTSKQECGRCSKIVKDEEEQLTEHFAASISASDKTPVVRLSSNSSADVASCFCGGKLTKTSSPYRPKSESDKMNLTLQKAKEEVKSRMNYCGKLYSDFNAEFLVRPYFIDPKPDLSLEPVHFVICVHGLDGNSGDLRLLRCFLEMALPSTKFEFLMSEINQDNTFLPFDQLTEKLVSEIIHHMEAFRISPTRISFIGHSLGNIIIRSALTHPLLKPYVDLFHTFLSLSGPHLGMIYHTSSLVSTGLWLMQKWKKSASLLQLSLNDSQDLRESFLYKLSKKKGLEYFTNVLLVSSVQDHYVPFHSSRIELPKTLSRSNSQECSVYREMMENILTPLLSKPNRTLVRYSVYHCLPSSTNSFIGRAAHIAMLDSELFIEKLICRSAAKYFQ